MAEQRRMSVTNEIQSKPLADFKLVIPYTQEGRFGVQINLMSVGEQEPQTREQLAAKSDTLQAWQFIPIDCTPVHVEIKAKRKSDGGIDEWDELYMVPLSWSNQEVDQYLGPRLRQVFEDVKDNYVSMGSGWRWTER